MAQHPPQCAAKDRHHCPGTQRCQPSKMLDQHGYQQGGGNATEDTGRIHEPGSSAGVLARDINCSGPERVLSEIKRPHADAECSDGQYSADGICCHKQENARGAVPEHDYRASAG